MSTTYVRQIQLCVSLLKLVGYITAMHVPSGPIPAVPDFSGHVSLSLFINIHHYLAVQNTLINKLFNHIRSLPLMTTDKKRIADYT